MPNYGNAYNSAFRTHPAQPNPYSMKNDLDPMYSYADSQFNTDPYYTSPHGSYSNVAQSNFGTGVHNQNGSAFNVVQSIPYNTTSPYQHTGQ